MRNGIRKSTLLLKWQPFPRVTAAQPYSSASSVNGSSGLMMLAHGSDVLRTISGILWAQSPLNMLIQRESGGCDGRGKLKILLWAQLGNFYQSVNALLTLTSNLPQDCLGAPTLRVFLPNRPLRPSPLAILHDGSINGSSQYIHQGQHRLYATHH